MKNFKYLSPVVLFLTISIITGCSSSSDSSNSANTSSFNVGSDFLLSATQDTAPVFSAPEVTTQNANSLKLNSDILPMATDNQLSGPYSFAYELLRSWNPKTDNGVVDMGNLYHVLDVAGDQFANIASSCPDNTIPLQKIASPFVFNDYKDNIQYSCLKNEGKMGESYPYGVAVHEEGSLAHLLVGFVWAGTPADEGEFNVIQGHYNSSTHDLDVRFTQVVTHDQSHFSRRTSVTGNDQTHAFIIRTVAGNLDNDSNVQSMVGQGISQGADNYFLFKYRTGNDSSNDKYLCISANADNSKLRAMHTENPAGKDTVDSNCASYKDDVDGLEFFVWDDMPHSLNDFANKSLLLQIP